MAAFAGHQRNMASPSPNSRAVGAAAVTQHVDDPGEASSPRTAWSRHFARRRGRARKVLLEEVGDSIWAPRGFWAYSDPDASSPPASEPPKVRTIVAEIGILQERARSRGERDRRGDAQMIVGADTIGRRGWPPGSVDGADSRSPDEALTPHANICAFEIELEVVAPTTSRSTR